MASQLFLEKIQGAVLRGEQTYSSYRCSFLTRNGACASERGIQAFGPKRLSACRRHGRMYDEELVNLQQRLKMDHDQGMHGTGDARKPFAELHTDSSGLFNLSCGDCRAAIQADELGVAPDKVQDASQIKRYLQKVQESHDNLIKNFKELVDQDRILRAIDSYGDEIKQNDVEHEWCQNVLSAMEEHSIDIVEAFDRVCATARRELLMNRGSEEYREGLSMFIRRGHWTLPEEVTR
jgi:hypothetical protein